MRHQRFGQRERSEVVGRECHVPAQRILAGACLHDARVVEQAGDRKMQRDDLRGRATHARQIRQIAHHRHRVLALLRDQLSHLLELAAVAADQHDRAMFGQFECRGATDAGGRAGDDVGLAI
jgi:hypothetical protein